MQRYLLHKAFCTEYNAWNDMCGNECMHIKIFIEYYAINEIIEGVPIKMRLGFCSIALAILIQQGLDYIFF